MNIFLMANIWWPWNKPAATSEKSGEIKEPIRVCIHSSAVLCLELCGLMLKELHITITFSNRPAEFSKQKGLFCTEYCIYGIKLPEISREQKLYFAHRGKLPSAISNDLQHTREWWGLCRYHVTINRNKFLPAWSSMELLCSSLVSVRFEEHANSFKIPGDFRKVV